MAKTGLKFTLEHDKETPGGKHRLKDEDGHSLYLSKGEYEKLGSPDSIELAVSAGSGE